MPFGPAHWSVEITVSPRKSSKQRRIDRLFQTLVETDTPIIAELSLLGRSTAEVIGPVNAPVERNIRLIHDMGPFCSKGVNKDLISLAVANGNSGIIHGMINVHYGAITAAEAVCEQLTMALATAGPEGPWAAPVYYGLLKSAFYFFSGPSCRHIEGAVNGAGASAAIFAQASSRQDIRGLQMSSADQFISRLFLAGLRRVLPRRGRGDRGLPP